MPRRSPRPPSAGALVARGPRRRGAVDARAGVTRGPQWRAQATVAALSGVPLTPAQHVGLDVAACVRDVAAVVDGVTPVCDCVDSMRRWSAAAAAALVHHGLADAPLSSAARALAQTGHGHVCASAAAASATVDGATRGVTVRLVADASAWAHDGVRWRLLPSGRDPDRSERGPRPSDHPLEQLRAALATRGAAAAWEKLRCEISRSRTSDLRRSRRVLCGDTRVEAHAAVHHVPAPHALLLTTDGVAAAAVGLGVVDDVGEVPAAVEGRGVVGLLHHLQGRQLADPWLSRWPRAHTVEDAAAALLRFDWRPPR